MKQDGVTVPVQRPLRVVAGGAHFLLPWWVVLDLKNILLPTLICFSSYSTMVSDDPSKEEATESTDGFLVICRSYRQDDNSEAPGGCQLPFIGVYAGNRAGAHE